MTLRGVGTLNHAPYKLLSAILGAIISYPKQGHKIYQRNKTSSQCFKQYGLGMVLHAFFGKQPLKQPLKP